jgi:hypothetical protein
MLTNFLILDFSTYQLRCWISRQPQMTIIFNVSDYPLFDVFIMLLKKLNTWISNCIFCNSTPEQQLFSYTLIKHSNVLLTQIALQISDCLKLVRYYIFFPKHYYFLYQLFVHRRHQVIRVGLLFTFQLIRVASSMGGEGRFRNLLNH